MYVLLSTRVGDRPLPVCVITISPPISLHVSVYRNYINKHWFKVHIRGHCLLETGAVGSDECECSIRTAGSFLTDLIEASRTVNYS